MIVNPYKFPTLKYFGNIIENISQPTYEQLLMIHTLFKDKIYKKMLLKKATSYTLFEDIEIETINRCNGTCSFCPVNRTSDKRKYHLMEEKLFYSIINQLHELNYKKVVCLHCNNEPLLDNRIFNFLEYARNKLPHAILTLYSNGTLLTPEKFHRIVPNLNLFIIDNYNNKLELNDELKPIHEICKTNNEYDKKVWITLRKQDEILTSRSGQAKNRKPIANLSSPCTYPFVQITIRPDGKVNLCCNDALGEETLGDTNKETLLEIWNGKNYSRIRQNMLKDRNSHPLCKKCDTVIVY